MREMTRPEFEAYETRVEAVLADLGTSVQPSKRNKFEELAAAARDVVNIRREYLELVERAEASARADDRPETENDVWDRAVVRQNKKIVERGNVVLPEVESAREVIDRAAYERRDTMTEEENLRHQLEQAASLALAGNTSRREIAEADRELRQAIEKERLDAQVERPAASRPYGGEEDRGDYRSASLRRNEAPLAMQISDLTPAPVEAKLVQLRGPSHDNVLDCSDEQAPIVDYRRVSRERDGAGQIAPSGGRAAGASDLPEQHVPRRRELERETEDRHYRESDERER